MTKSGRDVDECEFVRVRASLHKCISDRMKKHKQKHLRRGSSSRGWHKKRRKAIHQK
jgi:hypothetical protein